MKIDRVGGTPEIPQKNEQAEIQEQSQLPRGISEAPNEIETFSENVNPFSTDSFFSSHPHEPQGRPFTDPSFRPEHAQGRPFQDKEEEIKEALLDAKLPENEPTEPPEDFGLPKRLVEEE